MSSLMENLGASWIWPADNRQVENQYVEFRHEFDLEIPAPNSELLISADSNYAAWLNGTFLDCGQFSDYPDHKTFDTLPAAGLLKPGKNSLTILAFYQGKDSHTYLQGPAGLMYALKVGVKTIVSGQDTRYRKSPNYRCGPIPMITSQLSFVFEYDARNEGAWESVKPADFVAERKDTRLQPRPIPKLQIKDRLPAPVIAQGIFKRTFEPEQTVAQLMYADFLSPRSRTEIFKTESALEINPQHFKDHEGVYLVFDLGREEAGLFEMDIEAPAGTIIDAAYGEHLGDLRVRSAVGGRNFANRYIARSGRRQFTHYFTRWAGRYIQLHISGSSGRILLHYAGLRPTEYPVNLRGSFASPDHLQNQIYQTAIRTLHLCMHEHYEDCPWREQALYANDSRNQALCGYYAFGEYEFPKTSFALLGDGLKDDGYLEMCAPAGIPITIPSFSLCWILEVADYYRFTGDLNFIRAQMPRIKKMVDTYLKTLVEGLFPCPHGKRYWHFYDWADKLDGCWPGHETFFEVLDGPRFDAPLNAFFCLALQAAADLSGALGDSVSAGNYQAHADRLKIAFHEKFWDNQAGAYTTYLVNSPVKHFAELTQALAILAKISPDSVTLKLQERLASPDNGLVETTLSQSIHKFEALMEKKGIFGEWIFEKINRDWSYMLYQGATSFWETLKAGWDFDNAGSLCHGWSATPVYFYQAYLLGIKPAEPGFRTFTIDPVADVISRASGRVPTPFGPIDLAWEKISDKIEYTLSHPREIKPILVNKSMIKKG
jgi:alpha-L-rhamnosidase